MKKLLLLAGAAAGLSLAAALPAAAQSIDYGSLQTLFEEPVTTSATGSPQRSTEAPADMQIISADEIRRSGETTFPGILQRVAGIDVLNASAGQSDVSVRGYDQVSSPRLLVLVNGRQVYQDHYGVTNWASIPVQMDEIRQIEVVKGPNAALFGFNAVSGVVNIITYNPRFDDTDVVTLRAGAGGTAQASLVGTFKLGDKVSVRLSGGSRGTDEWKPTGPLPTPAQIRDPKSSSANLDLVAELGANTDLRVETSWSSLLGDALVGSGYAVQKMVTTSEKITLTSDTRLGTVQAEVYQNQLSAKYAVTGFIGWNNTVTVASLQDLFKVGTANTVRLGVEYRHNTLNVAPYGGADVSYDVLAGSGMWNWQVSPTVTTTAAVRVDRMSLERTGTFAPRLPQSDNRLWDREITKTSVNLTAAWRPTSADTWRLSYALGVQPPSLIVLGGIQAPLPIAPGVTFDLVGNPNLKASEVTNYELAYDHDFAPLKARVGVRVFMQDWKDLQGGFNTTIPDFFPTLTTNGGFTIINTSDSKMKGAEVTASGRFSAAWGWRGDYTYTEVKDSLFPGVNATNRSVAFAATTPKSRGNLGLDWETGPWEADANLHYVGDHQFYSLGSGALGPVKGFASLSARLGYRFDSGLTLAISGQNLLKERQQQTRGLEAERRLQFSISKAW